MEKKQEKRGKKEKEYENLQEVVGHLQRRVEMSFLRDDSEKGICRL